MPSPSVIFIVVPRTGSLYHKLAENPSVDARTLPCGSYPGTGLSLLHPTVANNDKANTPIMIKLRYLFFIL